MAASFSPVAVLSVLLLLARGSIAATLHEDGTNGARLVRRQTQHMELTPNAQMHQDKDDASNPQYCNYDFVEGTPGTHKCVDASLHSHVGDRALCELAGTLSGATYTQANMQIESADKIKGCYKTEAGGVTSYYFNNKEVPADPDATTLQGTPICSRARWWNGTKDSAAKDGGCPDGYAVVIDEDTCHKAGRCEREADDEEFRVGLKNASVHLDHPVGCFFDNVKQEVFYNPSRLNQGIGAPPEDSAVQGTPICNVTTTLNYA